MNPERHTAAPVENKLTTLRRTNKDKDKQTTIVQETQYKNT